MQTPGQEIGTHTLSHCYCLEDGFTVEAFEADLNACKRHGLATYRGNPDSWAYRETKGAHQTLPRRAMRLVDAYTGVLGQQTFSRSSNVLENVPASRFLRPCAGRLAGFHPRHIATIKQGMNLAAQSNKGYHLWWHPHNFGRDLEANMDGLRQIIRHLTQLRANYGISSLTMAEAA